MNLSLSHSQLETWQSCERKWKLQKLDRVPQAPAEALIVGDAVHQAIEADGRAWMADGAHLSIREMKTRFKRALDERTEHDDPTGLLVERFADMETRGRLLLESYGKRVQSHYHPTAVEEPFSLSVPDANGLIFTGRIDAIQPNAEGTPVILDYKTSSKAWPAGKEHETDQASAYLWATAPVHAVRCTFVVLSPAGVSIRPTVRTDRQLDAYVAKVRATATAITAAKASGEFEARTSALCAWCGCWGSCQSGRDYLRATGRAPAVPGIGPDGEVVRQP